MSTNHRINNSLYPNLNYLGFDITQAFIEVKMGLL